MLKTNTLRLAALVASGVVAVLLLALTRPEPAEAAFPGPNGKIAFEHDGNQIWLMKPNGDEQTQLAGVPGDNEFDPAISPNGAKIAFIDHDDEIWVMDSDGTNASQLTFHSPGGGDAQPAWSPDGKQIAFTRDSDIWAMNRDGTGQKNLTNTPSSDEFDPAWSPNGLEIAYARAFCEDNITGSCIYKMFANGLGQQPLVKPEEDAICSEGGGIHHTLFSEDPSWSPDGSKIAFTSDASCTDGGRNGGGYNIWVMNSDGSEKKDLNQDNGTGDYEPTWSPDGQKIAFVSDRDDFRGDIYVMDAEADDPQSGLVRITRNAGFDEDPDWGPPLRTISIPILAFTEEDRTPPNQGPCALIPNPGQPLQFLSVDEHDFFDADGIPDANSDGNTRIYGTMTVRGTPGDALQSLELEIVKGQDVIRAQLAPGARTALIKPFPSTGVLQISRRQLLFTLSSAQTAQFNTTTNDRLTLQVKATTQRGGTTTKTYSYTHPKTHQLMTDVRQLVLYDGTARYQTRNENEGGDGWVLPSLNAPARALSLINPGTRWGDFSNMNGGAICPHRGHKGGFDVDGRTLPPNAWYDARNAATASKILAMLRDPVNGTRIDVIWATFNPPGTLRRNWLPCEGGSNDNAAHGDFFNAIQNVQVPAAGGGTRLATNVIRRTQGHCIHFHVGFFP